MLNILEAKDDDAEKDKVDIKGRSEIKDIQTMKRIDIGREN